MGKIHIKKILVDKMQKIDDNILRKNRMKEKENEKDKKDDKKLNSIYIAYNIDILYTIKRARHKRYI